MAMDTSIKETSKENRNGSQSDQTSLKNGTNHKRNGTSYTIAHVNVNGNNCVKKDDSYKTDAMADCGEEKLSCGLGPCTPKWLQVFASKQAFLVTFCLTWVLQGMFSTYFVSVITTIEKLFQLQSKMTGMIMSATEIGQIGCTLLFTYYGGHGHRPRWIACGMVLFAVCSFTCSLPHFLFGYPSIPGNDIVLGQNSSFTSPFHSICFNDTTSFANRTESQCTEEILPEQQSRTKNIVLIIFLVSLLGVGMGQTPVYTLGISYIDDNVASRESPLYFAITIGIRILGPALGFIMGSVCTRLFIDLSIDPKISPTDPRWLGAWWLGLVLDAAFLLLASFAMFSFPEKLKSHRNTLAIRSRQESTKKHPKLKDFPKTIKRLLKNDILMYRSASSVLHILPIAGLYTFLPKFLESQFRFPAHTANMVTGVGGILVMGLGIIISGIFIIRVKPNARFVAAWIACAAALYAIGMGILMFVGCPMNDLVDLRNDQRGTVSVISDCASSCHCERKFSPVCGADKFTHFSACYAGCQNITSNDGVIEFSNCVCMNYSNVTHDMLEDASNYKATIGYCDFDCNNFVWYILIFSFFVFIHSTSEVGSMLLTLRCVDPRDKAMALGVIQFAIGLFGNVPCSVIYGAVVDSTCLVWEMVCGKTGACSLYDTKAFRHYFHGTTSAIMLCAFVVDLIVWYKADNVNFGTDEPLPHAQEEELTPIAEKSCCENSKN